MAHPPQHSYFSSWYRPREVFSIGNGDNRILVPVYSNHNLRPGAAAALAVLLSYAGGQCGQSFRPVHNNVPMSLSEQRWLAALVTRAAHRAGATVAAAT